MLKEVLQWCIIMCFMKIKVCEPILQGPSNKSMNLKSSIIWPLQVPPFVLFVCDNKSSYKLLIYMLKKKKIQPRNIPLTGNILNWFFFCVSHTKYPSLMGLQDSKRKIAPIKHFITLYFIIKWGFFFFYRQDSLLSLPSLANKIC